MATVPNTSVDQIFEALHLISGTEDALGVVDLAREMSLPTSTAHRLLVTLYDSGFAERDSTGTKYELGSRAYELVHGLFGQYGVRQASLPFLARLVRRTGETTTLDVRVGWYTVRMAGFEGWREIHAGTLVGRTLPLGRSAGGHAILAALTDNDVERYLSWEAAGPRRGPRTREIRAAVSSVRSSGFARMTAHESGAAALSLPVHHEGRPLAAVSIEGMGPLLLGETRPAGDLKRILKVVADLETALDEEPRLAHDPFGHIDPDTLRLLPLRGTAED